MSLLGVLGGIASVAGGVLTGNLGKVAGGIGSVLSGGGGVKPQVSVVPSSTGPAGMGFAGTGPGYGYGPPDSVVTRGGGASIGFGPASIGGTGYKSVAYFGGSKRGLTKSGKPRKLKKNGQPYKRPTMNEANPRALKRAIRRIDGFKHLAHAVGFHAPKKLAKVSKAPFTRKKR